MIHGGPVTKLPHEMPAADINSSSHSSQTNRDLIRTLEDNDDVHKVVPYDEDSRLNGLMVILDWATDVTIENGTRTIHDKKYTGEIRRVHEFIRNLDGIERVKSNSSGLTRYTIHTKYTP